MAEYRFHNHMVEVKDTNDGKYYPYCEEIRITKVITNFFTGRKTVEIVIYTDGDPTPFRLPRRALNRNILTELIDHGLTVIDNNLQAETILEVLFDSEGDAEKLYEHDRLGFKVVKGKQIFFAHTPIGPNHSSKAQSEYYDPVKTKPSGSFESWRKLVQREVIGHINLELALALSVSGPVAHLLREAKVIPLVPIWALVGHSSRGKTTALKLMASVWGSPEESSGLITDLNATQNAFFAQLGNSCGLPALIDETSSSPEWDFTKTLYNLPKGRDKLRCATDGTVRPSIHYSGAIILTGEHSLFEQTNGNQGLLARLIEFPYMWTDDEHHAQRLEFGVRWNYGTAVTPLMEWMLSYQNTLPKIHRWFYHQFKDLMGYSPGVEDRMAKMYAIICTAAIALRSALKISINVSAIKNLLLDLHRNNSRIHSDPAVIFEKLKHQILEHNSYFPTDRDSAKAPKIWGEHDIHNGNTMYWISVPVFENLMKKAGATDVDSFRPVFHEHGWMYRTRDRHYDTLHKLGGVKTKCYRLFLDVNPPGYRPPTLIPKGSMIDFLLDPAEDD